MIKNVKNSIGFTPDENEKSTDEYKSEEMVLKPILINRLLHLVQ